MDKIKYEKRFSRRFWKRVSVGRVSECWEWKGIRDKDGYGTLSGKINGVFRPVRAHRVSYYLVKGNIPEGLLVLHSCDNPPCVNPRHLRAGSQSENIREAVTKGRKPIDKGDKHHLCKLSDNTVQYIRESDATQGKLARELSVSQSLISRIRSGDRR